ncbi:MAG: hypothetical protein E7593_00160 [Ruminococcaceae bacterium]|nr:hypothetical protein [Oscillospiraceae bacterium]
MTLREAISKFDRESKNNIPDDIKIEWVSLLDSAIYNDIILTHETKTPLSFSGYTTQTDDNTVLLVPEPFSDIYLRFLTIKKDLYLSDISRYNNDVVLYSTAYRDFENYYNRNNMPIKKTYYFNA